jgi:hypothetical protein
MVDGPSVPAPSNICRPLHPSSRQPKSNLHPVWVVDAHTVRVAAFGLL